MSAGPTPFRIGQVTQEWAEKSGIPTWYQPETTSTNTVAKEEELEKAPITLYLTDHQSAGRGRGSNTWSEDANTALLSSWVFHMSRPPQPVLAPALGLALWTAVSATFPWLKFSLKAPNDLYLNDKKVAGLLLENVQQGNAHRLIVGLGMNVFKAPSQVCTAISLADILKESFTQTAWINVLDRLLLEMSLAVSQTKQDLTMVQRKALLHALNLNPNLSPHYQKIDSDGSLWTSDKKINWSEL